MYNLEFTFSNRPNVKFKCGFTKRAILTLYMEHLIHYALSRDLMLWMNEDNEKRWYI